MTVLYNPKNLILIKIKFLGSWKLYKAKISTFIHYDFVIASLERLCFLVHFLVEHQRLLLVFCLDNSSE